jgi:hypothetical protein
LFTPKEPTSAEAWKTVERFPLKARFYQAKRGCRDSCCRAGPSHGPYWFAEWRNDVGRRICRYIGKQDKYEGIQLAHAAVRRELEAAEATAGGRRLRMLEERAGMIPARARDRTVNVPIVEVGGGTRPR